ncbi:unnamed protein product, partial [Symbiodinium pilosum]
MTILVIRTPTHPGKKKETPKSRGVLSLPSIADIIVHGDRRDRVHYLVGVAVASMFLGATAFLCLSHQRELLLAPVSPRRKYYILMHLFPFVVACSCWFQVAAPELAVGTLLLQEIWEALALHFFALAIIDLMGGPETTVRILANLEPRGLFGRNRWCVPPCCCAVALLPCAFRDGTAVFDDRTLSKMLTLIEQYCYVAPVAASAITVLDFNTSQRQLHVEWLFLAELLVQLVQSVSMFCCLQALFALYRATHDVLHRYKTTSKFLAIKMLILLSLIQKTLVVWIFHTSLVLIPGSRVFTHADAATRVQAFL